MIIECRLQILTKTLATRIKVVLHTINHPDQK